jgi:exosortase
MYREPALAPSEGVPLPGSRAIWQAVSVALLAGMGIVIAVFYSAFASAVAIWNQSSAHQFSYLVIPISLYFIWLRRHRLAHMVPAPDARAVWLALPCGLLWLASHVAQIDIGVQFAAVGMLQIVFLALLGRDIYRVLLFPFAFLWLLVPFGDSLTVSLMELTSAMTVGGLTLLGLDAHAEGTVLIAEGMRYLIVEECAALDFIIGNLVVSLVYANLMYTGLKKRWLYSLAAVPVAILANVFRTTSIVFITHASDWQIGLAYDHATYGWFVFLFAVAGQMGAGWRYRDRDADPPPVEAAIVGRLSLQRVLLIWIVVFVLARAADRRLRSSGIPWVAAAFRECARELPRAGRQRVRCVGFAHRLLLAPATRRRAHQRSEPRVRRHTVEVSGARYGRVDSRR